MNNVSLSAPTAKRLTDRIRDGAIETLFRYPPHPAHGPRLTDRVRDGAIETPIGGSPKCTVGSFGGLPIGFAMARLKLPLNELELDTTAAYRSDSRWRD